MFSRTSSNICLGAIGAICLLLLIAAAAPLTISRDYKIANNTDSVKLTIQQSGTQSANAIEIYRGGNLELAVPGTNTVAGLKTKLGFDAGNKIVTSVSTNVTFATTYSAAPV